MAAKNRKELNENELAGAMTDKFDQIKPHLPKILLGFAAVALIVFGVNYFVTSQEAAKEAKSINMILFGVENSSSGSSTSLDQQIEDYPDDNTAAWAHLLKGDRQLGTGMSRIFSDRVSGEESIQNSIEQFKKANEQAGEDSQLKQRALFSWARAEEALGRWEEATTRYAELLEYKGSPFAKMAEKAISRVKNPDNQEFYILFRERKNNSFELDPLESAPTTNTGLPARPDFTYPGEEPVVGNEPGVGDQEESGNKGETAPEQNPEENATPESKPKSEPPAPPEGVSDGKEKSPSPPAATEDKKQPLPKNDVQQNEAAGTEAKNSEKKPSAEKVSPPQTEPKQESAEKKE
ncbi:MAG: hypothetical protein VX768_07575 [Planctomycetota bacterium]|nr:hypothetical protein [Planctomycetota bacterium]